MKEYPEPNGRWLDIAEAVIMALVAAGLCVCVVFAVYFAANILGGVK